MQSLRRVDRIVCGRTAGNRGNLDVFWVCFFN